MATKNQIDDFDNALVEATRDLGAYQNQFYDPGRGPVVRTVWYYISLVFFESSWFPFTKLKSLVLRRFGAKVGQGLVIHPNVRIKYPWRLVVGNNCWIGREAWIDNLDMVTLESDVCISQGAYLCTGSHDHRSRTFELRTGPITIKHGSWVCCRAIVLGGATLERMSLVPAGQIYSREKTSETISINKPR